MADLPRTSETDTQALERRIELLERENELLRGTLSMRKKCAQHIPPKIVDVRFCSSAEQGAAAGGVDRYKKVMKEVENEVRDALRAGFEMRGELCANITPYFVGATHVMFMGEREDVEIVGEN